jgi:hypothetical protein
MTRRSPGDGSVYYDASASRWVGAATVGYREGKRLRKRVTGTTKSQVRTKLKELMTDLDKGVVPVHNYTVGHAIDAWLAEARGHVATSTKTKDAILCQHLRDHLGHVRLRELCARDVTGALTALSGELATSSLRRVHQTLQLVIRHAEANDLVGRNVAALVTCPSGQTGRASKSLTLEQTAAVLRAAESSWLHAYIVLSLTTGLRTEEVRALP